VVVGRQTGSHHHQTKNIYGGHSTEKIIYLQKMETCLVRNDDPADDDAEEAADDESDRRCRDEFV
jgi:hypothetical protein